MALITGSTDNVISGLTTQVNDLASELTPFTNPISFGNVFGNDLPASSDLRVRLKPLSATDFYPSSGVLDVLKSGVGGILFPYTPNISFSQTVNYMDVSLVHSNTDYPAYTRTPSVSIGLNAKFTVQSQNEGRYAVACLHFLRAASKSYFGETDQRDGKAGLPPPVLMLSGYGNYMFNDLRVVLKSHSWSFDDSADGVTIAMSDGGRARLPALFTVACELTVVQTPTRMRTKFSWPAFASGELMKSSNPGWI